MSTKEEELFDAMARTGRSSEYIKGMIEARRELFGEGSKEGCARCSAKAHAAMAAPEGGASVTDPSKPTKPVVVDDDLRERLRAAVAEWRTEIMRKDRSDAWANAFAACGSRIEHELAK